MKKFFILLSVVVMAMTGVRSVAQSRVVEFDNPRMKVFLPPKGMENGKAVVACPGGGYSHLAMDHEGYQWAPFFNDLGFAYAVVAYTMPKGDPSIPRNDLDKCFKIIADSASVWKIRPDSIGIMGSSAGGHLASAMSTHPTANCRPAFQILFYPVISFDAAITHKGSREGFIGPDPSEALVEEWSSDRAVTPQTPPAFITLCSDDKVVVPDNSLRYYKALTDAGVPATMIIYPTGRHGFGSRPAFKYHGLMTAELARWLKDL